MVPQQRRRRRRGAQPRTTERRVVVARGPGGFGFTIAGQRPCVVSAVAAGGPADRAGLRAGDALLAVEGASVARAPHAAVARLVASAAGPIMLGVALRERDPPTDTEDTEPDERARVRRRHPPPRRRPHYITTTHHSGDAGPSSSGLSAALQNLSGAQLSQSHGAASLECRALVGYLGTIETPAECSSGAPGEVRAAVKKLRQERRVSTPVLVAVQPGALVLRRLHEQPLAEYPRARILYAGCGSDSDRRYFGLVTAPDADASHSCHVFAVDPRMAEHDAHAERAQHFEIQCTRDPVAERCLEFPPSAEYVVGVIRGMYSLPPDDHSSPTFQQLSKLAIKGNSPSPSNFARCSRAVFRAPRDRRARPDGLELGANSPQPSNHSEITTTSSNSDSGIGFHNDCRNIADRILVVDFAGHQPPPSCFRPELPPRPIGLVGCGSFDGEGSFLSNTTPVVDGFGGLERPLNLDDVMINSNESIRHASPRGTGDYNYNNIYSNFPPPSLEGTQQVAAEIQSYCSIPPEIEQTAESLKCMEVEEDHAECQSTQSLEEVTVISGASRASIDSVSVCSTRSHEEGRARSCRRHLQASLDDMLVLQRHSKTTSCKPPPGPANDHNFLHPATVQIKVRKSKPLGLVWKTLGGRRRGRALSGDAGDQPDKEAPLPAAASAPDLRDTQGDQTSPFRRWTTSNGAASSMRKQQFPSLPSKMRVVGESSSAAAAGASATTSVWKEGGVARWALGLDHLLADPVGVAAFNHFLDKEFATENLRFWLASDRYAKSKDISERAALATHIWETHLTDTAPEPVNLDAAARNNARALLNEDPIPLHIFSQAQNQIFIIMKFDNYPRFLKSDIHAECARADLRGLPPPYPPFQLEYGVSSTKLKKSTSNASERRRSGGSLLPWRRGASRDRSAAAGQPVEPRPSTSSAALPPPSPPPVAPRRADLARRQHLKDVMMGAAGGAVGLCRVVMPDGATSVVGVERAQRVRDVVDRLLARRHMHAPAYDVITTDDQRTTVELEASAMCLAGREVVAEERAVVRFEVSGRAVGVRCRATRRLRRVLRLLVPRLPAGLRAVVAAEDHWLHPDSRMRDLHGRWLSVHQVPGDAAHSPPIDHQRDDLYDVLIVTDPDQLLTDCRFEAIRPRTTPAEWFQSKRRPTTSSQSLCSAVSCRSPETVVSGGGAPRAAPSPVTSIAECGEGRPEPLTAAHELSGSESWSGRYETLATTRADKPGQTVVQLHAPPAARVRAALRPGAPLHQHAPADFLESLQHTRRQILEKRPEGAATPPPPPLPPKPARLPTYV